MFNMNTYTMLKTHFFHKYNTPYLLSCKLTASSKNI